MGTRSDIIVHGSDGKWRRIYCHWDGYLEHNGRILFDHYTGPKKVDALVKLGNISSLGEEIGVKHPFDKPRMHLEENGRYVDNPAYVDHMAKYGRMCTAYIRDRGMGGWHYAKTKAEFVEALSATVADSLFEIWPEGETWTEFTYVWDNDKWYVGVPDEGTQTLRDLGDALQGKVTVHAVVKLFGMPIGKHQKTEPGKDHGWVEVTTVQRKPE